jgi:hypothetical protein
MPAGFKVPPHSHPTAEQVTVLSGDFVIAMGDRLDETKGQEFKPGASPACPPE